MGRNRKRKQKLKGNRPHSGSQDDSQTKETGRKNDTTAESECNACSQQEQNSTDKNPLERKATGPGDTSTYSKTLSRHKPLDTENPEEVFEKHKLDMACGGVSADLKDQYVSGVPKCSERKSWNRKRETTTFENPLDQGATNEDQQIKFTLCSDDQDSGSEFSDSASSCKELENRTSRSSDLPSNSSSQNILMKISSQTAVFGNHNQVNNYDSKPDGNLKMTKRDIPRSYSESHVKTFAEAVSYPTLNAESVTINIGRNSSQTEKIKIDSRRQLVDLIQNFSRGHYILVTGRLGEKCMPDIDSLFLAPWTAVFDLDPETRHSGLLCRVEPIISKVRSLHIASWQDKCAFNENSTYWIGTNGYSDRPATRTEDEFKSWKKHVKGSLENQVKQLNKFGESCTVFTVVVFWSQSVKEFRHIACLLEVLGDILNPTIVIIDEGTIADNDADLTLKYTLMCHGENAKHVIIPFPLAVKCIASVIRPSAISSTSNFQLPTSDKTQITDITDQEAQWLKEDLDVLYIHNKTGTELDQTALEQEKDTFFRGGNLTWSWWYQMGPGHVDTERDVTKDLINKIETQYIETCHSGCMTLLHNPGSGGTTLSQRVVWNLREKVPCAQVKHRHGLSVTELADKVKFISDRTRLPVLLLVIGEDEQMVSSIQRYLRDTCTVIVFYVKRTRIKIEQDSVERNQCKLKSFLSKKEARDLGSRYKSICQSAAKREKVTALVNQVEKGQRHTIFEFGLAVHSYEYHGIEPFVREFLNLKDTLKPWQKALAYLSLVYYYGQASVPCKFLAGFLEEENTESILTYEDFPEEMKEFMVRDVQERKSNMVRITHFYVAKEILDQILTFPKAVCRKPSPQICEESKKKLADLAVGFLKEAGALVSDEPSPTIEHIMTRTFILRDSRTTGENETSIKRKPRFSLILEDVSRNNPHTERFEILQQLTCSFPHAAQFRAHLGRLYTICRPGEHQKAEECFKQALKIIDGEFPDRTDLPNNKKLDLMHIYHMYGNMVLLQIAQYTGRFIGDKPKVPTQEDMWEVRAKELLPLVKKSCFLFKTCRDVTPLGCEESFGYIGEIHVRLMYCCFVDRYSKRGIHEYSHSEQSEVASFLRDCYTELDELFLLCFSSTEPDKMDENIFNCQKEYEILFKTIPGNIVHKKEDTIASRRLHIAKIKMKYCSSEKYGILEQIDNREDICIVVKELESNFDDYLNNPLCQATPKRTIDLDHREWIVAVRHPLFPENYDIEKVLKVVTTWHEQVNSPHSRFYVFVIKSLLGIGNKESSGHASLLVEAQQLKDDVIKHSRYVTKPRYPREWLGINQIGIRRLAPGRRFLGNIEDKDNQGIDFSTLELHKGTIMAPNNKPAVGYIILDLGPSNRVEVTVFFVPARTSQSLKGTCYDNKRVEFVLGFSLQHGYEAFAVKLLAHVTCFKCGWPVERRSCDLEVECPRCHVKVKCQKLLTSRQGAQYRNGKSSSQPSSPNPRY